MRALPATIIGVALLAAASDAEQRAPYSFEREVTGFRTVELDSGKLVAESTTTIERRDQRSTLVENRRLGSGVHDSFRVVIDASSGQPLSWTHRATKAGETTTSRILFGAERIEAQVTHPDGKTQRSDVARPRGPFTVTPLIKYFLAGRMAQGAPAGAVQVLVLQDGSLETHEVAIEDLGVKEIKVKGERHACRHLRIRPTSMLVAALMAPADMYLDVSGSHPLIKMTGSAHRLAPKLLTQRTAYQAK